MRVSSVYIRSRLYHLVENLCDLEQLMHVMRWVSYVMKGVNHRKTFIQRISHAKENLTFNTFLCHDNELLLVTAPHENGINKFSCEQMCALYKSRKRETYCFDIGRIFKKIHRNPINQQKISARAS